jgi:hypothetical protein
LPLRAPVFLVCFLFLASANLAGGAESAEIFFKTSPRTELLRPFADPIDLSLLVTGANGKPVENGSVAVRLEAPRPGRFFSTDYPLVQGTLLNEMRLPLRQGRAAWKYLFPIRGEYRLAVDFMSEDGTKANKVFSFRVREQRAKVWALTGFSFTLLVLGFVAGRIFTTKAMAGVLLCGGMVWGASMGNSHVTTESGPQSLGLEIEPATVGRPSLVRWKRTEASSGLSLLSLSIVHIEKQKTVFAVDQMPVENEWGMKFHFPDGAGYRVSAIAQTPGQASIRSEQVVAVTGIEPPASAFVPPLIYFIGLISLGLAAGRWSKRPRRYSVSGK